MNDNAPSSCLVLLEVPCETPNIEYIAKIVNDLIESTIFAERSILDVFLGSEYVSDYLRVFSIVID